MSHQDIFDSLTRNAFDFLQHAVAEFDRAPKYSVIHFCSAVEMLLKARLMQEHWSLIVSKPDQADLAKFKAGDFISVTLQEARARIRNIANEDIGDEAYASFRTLANHRNKVVHFFHYGLESDQTAKEAIVAEQCRAWFHLHRLLQNWASHFSEFNQEIQRANHAMLQHRQYLDAKFNALKPELDAARKAGNVPKTCPACDYEALDKNPGDKYLDEVCRICGYESPSHEAIRQGDEAFIANCLWCDAEEMVIASGRGYACQNCKEIFPDYITCEYCQSNWVGKSNTDYGSYLYGCHHCDGAFTYMMAE